MLSRGPNGGAGEVLAQFPPVQDLWKCGIIAGMKKVTTRSTDLRALSKTTDELQKVEMSSAASKLNSEAGLFGSRFVAVGQVGVTSHSLPLSRLLWRSL